MRDLVDEIKEFYNWLLKFITDDIWHLDIDDFSKAKRKFIKYLKVTLITVKEAGIKHLGLYAFSLSFFSTMSMVPFVAVAFGVTEGFGLKGYLQEMLLEYFSSNKEMVELVIQFAENIVTISQQDAFGIVSLGFFIGTVLWLILNVEKCFNIIWKAERGRSLAKRFLYYFGVLIVAPLVMTMFLSVSLAFTRTFNSFGFGIEFLASAGRFIQWAAFYGIISLFFTIIYKYVPNVKVKFSAAFFAALVAALAFVANFLTIPISQALQISLVALVGFVSGYILGAGGGFTALFVGDLICAIIKMSGFLFIILSQKPRNVNEFRNT